MDQLDEFFKDTEIKFEVEEAGNKKKFKPVKIWLFFAVLFSMLFFVVIPIAFVISSLVAAQIDNIQTVLTIITIVYVIVSITLTIIICKNVIKARWIIRLSVTTFHIIFIAVPLLLLTLGLVVYTGKLHKLLTKLDHTFFVYLDKVYVSDIHIQMTLQEAYDILMRTEIKRILRNLRSECKTIVGMEKGFDHHKVSDACTMKIELLDIKKRKRHNVKAYSKNKKYQKILHKYEELCIIIKHATR